LLHLDTTLSDTPPAITRLWRIEPSRVLKQCGKAETAKPTTLIKIAISDISIPTTQRAQRSVRSCHAAPAVTYTKSELAGLR
jgi:hypothetical protein